jgi:hypothetical protein
MITFSVNGVTVSRPGAYSKTTIATGGGFPVGPAGLVALIGEADAGKPGADLTNLADNVYTGDQLATLKTEYRSGPIADAVSWLFAPASDAAVPGGAQNVWIYKTNSSVRATLALANTYGTVRAREYGIGGNRISFQATAVGETVATPTASSAAFNETTIASGAKFDLYVNGAKNTFTFASAPTNNADLVAQLALGANWSAGAPTVVVPVVTGSSGASIVTFTMAAAPLQYQLGFGRSYQLVNGLSTPLTAMNIAAAYKTPSVEPSVSLRLDNKRDNIQETGVMGGNVVLKIGRDLTGSPTSASVTVDADNVILKEGGSPVYTLPKASYSTLSQLVDELNLVTYGGWSAAMGSTDYNSLPLSVLDQVTDVGCLSPTQMPARLKKDADEVFDFFASTSIASLEDQELTGLPAALSESLLAGGLKGGTSTASVVAALEKFEKFHVNFVLPLFSRDATADIADSLTDATSTYTIAGIHQAVKTHISLMATTKKRSERQGFLSLKDTYTNCKAQAGVLADGRIQLAIQDIRQNDAQGNIKWFQPYALAALLCGARSGASIAEPLTYKYMNCAGIRQTAQSMTTPDADIVTDFDPDLQYDSAIQMGITFLEAPTTGGFRVVVDNTTYSRDENFVWNRGSVIYAMDTTVKNLRDGLEGRFIGQKNTVSPSDISSEAARILTALKNQGVLVGTADAPQGYRGLVSRIEGNVAFVDVAVKIVESLDFIQISLGIERAIQA